MPLPPAPLLRLGCRTYAGSVGCVRLARCRSLHTAAGASSRWQPVWSAGAATPLARWSVAVRRFSSSAKDGHSTHARSQALAAHFVPFGISETDARAAYRGWADKQPLAPASIRSASAIVDTDAVYLPFFCFDVAVSSRFGGRIGYDTSQTVWNARTQRWEMQTVTQWRVAPLEITPSHATYSSDLPSNQIYAAFKHKWDPIQVVKSPLSGGRVRTPSQMSPRDFEGKEVDVFEMKLDTAHARVVESMRLAEIKRGEQRMMQMYKADRVDVQAEMRIVQMQLRRVYQPAYVFQVQHLGQQFEVIVNGVTGAVSGQRIYSDTKVAAAFTVPATLAWVAGALWAHVIPLTLPSFIVCVVLPTLAAGVAARYWAPIREIMREYKRIADREADDRMASGTYNAEWYANQQRQQSAGQGAHEQQEHRYEQQYERAQQQQQQQYQPKYKKAPAQNLYQQLGVKPGATLDEIRTAFRAKSFQYHPDVNKAPDATTKFRQILEAYQTLRDPVKRAAYDRTL